MKIALTEDQKAALRVVMRASLSTADSIVMRTPSGREFISSEAALSAGVDLVECVLAGDVLPGLLD